ncbi:hypothetical protein V5N11_018116 [Cardamine amara subsp. amara]|uniref:Uncharacterized protein n=1 Tax=Cardamine amara subsp. amara TaxID=228776 RepID=A0ABD1AIX7_CARAN
MYRRHASYAARTRRQTPTSSSNASLPGAFGYLLRVRFSLTPLSSLSHTSSWILNNTPTSAPHAHGKEIIGLLLQSVIYATWRERNARIFTDTHTSAAAIKPSIDRTMRDRLLSYPTQDSRSVTLLQYYFGCMSLPL